ncbi:hypothetical protein [Chondrinema litorale]|uniref:hypothetical protein n=1 Tax=Chondrinema litorale TaxID=2994555 RepID=UPI0025438D68|nr:hypothetical protein [Chondrinema litorale]UZR92318.1 hypothetical protein OQ292_10640 [Chondrinema litorale]
MYKNGIIALINIILLINVQFAYSQDLILYHSNYEERIFKELKNGKLTDTLGFMLASNVDFDAASKMMIEEQLMELIKPLVKRVEKEANSMRTLRKLNKTVASNYLKNYEKLSDFSEIVTTGTYDCLTSTLLYAYLLEKLGYNYSIKETNYHIYLVVNLENKDVLIEPTDPYYGFVWEKKYIEKRIANYRADNIKGEDDFLASLNLDKKINLLQLASLQYYNIAVKQFNNRHYERAVNSVKKSMMIYDCERNRLLLDYSMEFIPKLSSSTLK